MERFDVIISGASYTGLALARALSLAFGGTILIALVDRSRAPDARPDARAFALAAASRNMLDALGVWSAVDSEAQPVVDIDITDSSLDAGVRPVHLTYRNVLAGGEPATYIVPGPALMRALSDAVANDTSIERIAPETVTTLKVGEGNAEIRLESGRKLSAPLVVAADGRRSTLREAAGIKITKWSYGQTGIVTTVAHERPHDGKAVQHFLPAGPFAILPLTGKRACITWSEEAREAERIMALDDTAFLREVDRRFGGRLGAIELAGPRQSWPLEMHLARAYTSDRLALIGDTAHGVHPIAGQGLNLGFRDVAALTEAAAEAARLGYDLGSAVVLERYERWRRFDSTTSALTYDGINRLFSNDSTLLRAARDLGLGVVDRLPDLKARFVEEAAGLSGETPRLLRGLAV